MKTCECKLCLRSKDFEKYTQGMEGEALAFFSELMETLDYAEFQYDWLVSEPERRRLEEQNRELNNG